MVLVVLLSMLGSNLSGVRLEGVFGGEEEGGGVRSGPRAARTILLFHIISARPSKQPRMVRTFREVYGARLLFFVSERTNKRHQHHLLRRGGNHVLLTIKGLYCIG